MQWNVFGTGIVFKSLGSQLKVDQTLTALQELRLHVAIFDRAIGKQRGIDLLRSGEVLFS